MKKDDKKPVYILCPRCELNYINKKEKYCTVCKAEMGLVDPSVLIPDEEEAGVEKLCPVCHVNYIGEDEEICFLCQKERDEHSDSPIEPEPDWQEFDDSSADGEITEGIGLPIDEEEEIFAGEDEEEEEPDPDAFVEPDDFDFSGEDADFGDEDDDEDSEEDEYDSEEDDELL